MFQIYTSHYYRNTNNMRIPKIKSIISPIVPELTQEKESFTKSDFRDMIKSGSPYKVLYKTNICNCIEREHYCVHMNTERGNLYSINIIVHLYCTFT